MSASAWCAVAGYLYVLHLDGQSLAWEYLRRNADYQADWRRSQSEGARGFRAQWGIAFAEDPSADARAVQPLWCPSPETLVKITASDEDGGGAQHQFSLWSIPGRKAMVHNGRHVVVTARQGARALRMSLAQSVRDGCAYAFLINAGPRARARWQWAEQHLDAIAASTPSPRYAVATRPGRLQMLHMRVLQVMDGIAAGASHREIAIAIFGARRVDDAWHADSELRAQVRHWVRRGQALVAGGYRQLIFSDRYGDECH